METANYFPEDILKMIKSYLPHPLRFKRYYRKQVVRQLKRSHKIYRTDNYDGSYIACYSAYFFTFNNKVHPNSRLIWSHKVNFRNFATTGYCGHLAFLLHEGVKEALNTQIAFNFHSHILGEFIEL